MRISTGFSRDPTILVCHWMVNTKLIASGLDNWEDADYCSLLQNKDTPQASI
jgi:hypothetical protein